MRVGITGHQWDKLARADREPLIERIREVLARIEAITDRVHADPRSGYRPETPFEGMPEVQEPELRLISPLAEGADRLLPAAAPPRWRLQAILPMPVEEYRETFSSPHDPVDDFDELLRRARSQAGVQVLDRIPTAGSRFEALANVLAVSADVLIAIWNREKSASRGGTGAVVELAVANGIPVVLIPVTGTGEVTLHGDAGPVSEDGQGLENLEARIRRLLDPPEPDPDDHEKAPELREKYFRERWRPGRLGQFYDWMVDILGAELFPTPEHRIARRRRAALPFTRTFPRDPGLAIRERWRRAWVGTLGLPEAFAEPILRTSLPTHYGWSSHLANYYAGRYRTTFLWAYGLAGFAILFAAIGYLAVPEEAIALKLLFGGLEFVLLAWILAVVLWARHHDFHERWLEYRAVTESLRSLVVTLPLGVPSALAAGRTTGAETWVDWMHRAVVREVGLLPVEMTPDHLRSARTLLLEGTLREQVRHHQRNEGGYMRIAHRLEGFGTWGFVLALALALYHLLHMLHVLPLPHGAVVAVDSVLTPDVSLIVATSIPAFAAACHGFLSQMGLHETAIRSRNVRRQLEDLHEQALTKPVRLDSQDLGAVAKASVATMNSEMGAWFAAYQGRPPSLP